MVDKDKRIVFVQVVDARPHERDRIAQILVSSSKGTGYEFIVNFGKEIKSIPIEELKHLIGRIEDATSSN